MARIKDDYVDDMLERAKEEPGQEERAAIYNELCSYLNECMVYIPLYQSTVIRACSERLGGFDVSPAGTVRFEQVYFKE